MSKSSRDTLILDSSCANCGGEVFHPGPCGGAARNFQCVLCKATFSCAPAFTQRIARDDTVYDTTSELSFREVFAANLIQHQAAEWLIEQSDPHFSTEQRNELQAWLDSNPLNRAAYEPMERDWKASQQVLGKHLTEVARIIRITDERREFIDSDDGSVVYAPTTSHGYLTAWILRALADELDRRNAPHEAEINRYFDEHPSTPEANPRE